MENKFLRCDEEPIHIPNFIQPIGYFLAINLTNKTISHMSQNIVQEFPDMTLYTNIELFIEKFDELLDTYYKHEENRVYLYNQSIQFSKTNTQYFDFILSQFDPNYFFIEFVPTSDTKESLIYSIATLTNKLLQATDEQHLFENITHYMKNEIGYDRVMIYKFDKENNGQVIYEKKESNLESYLDLHYPASDIPAQAREIYLKNHIRIISDASYKPSKIVTDEKHPIDMTYSFLRSVSPIHLEYMKNMGVVASMTISLIVNDKLWGLIACHHQSQLTPSLKTINECEHIGKIVSSLIKIHSDKRQMLLINQFSNETDLLLEIFKTYDLLEIDQLFTRNLEKLQKLFHADGIIFYHNQKIEYTKINLPHDDIIHLTHKILQYLKINKKKMMSSDSTLKYFPDLNNGILKECSGIIAFKLFEDKEYYCIFTRNEKQRELNWGGNPDEKIKDNSKKYLSPRQSFARFTQVVEYKAKDWPEALQEKIETFIQKIIQFQNNLLTQFELYQKSSQLKAAQIEKNKHNEQLVDLLLRIIEMRDAYTAGHTLRVAKICDLLAIEMGVDEHNRVLLNQAAKLHDIGKVIIPDSILLKPGRLNPNEYDIIKLHLKVGYEMLSTIDYYKPIAEIMKYHHEKYDGSGYPYGKKEEDIPFLSQLMMVADAVDAMTSNRIYQRRKNLQETLAEIQSLSGKWYHPNVVNALERIIQKGKIELADTSQIPLTKMEHERFSYFFKDQMTNFYNEPYLWMIINEQIPQYKITDYFLIELHAMSKFNKINGWHAGNTLINNIAKILTKRFHEQLIFRIYGDTFLICFKSKEDYLKHTREWKEIKLGPVFTSSKNISKLEITDELQSIL